MRTALRHGVTVAAPAGTAGASAALRGVLAGPPLPWRVLGSTSGASWCAAEDDVIVITPDGGAGLPNGVVVSGRGLTRPGPEVVVGDGGIRCRDRGWRVVRWWDPVPSPIANDPAAMAERVGDLAATLGAATPGTLGRAMACGDPGAVLEAARRLMGRGAGLTPEGDDHIAGAAAGYRYAALCIGSTSDLLVRVRGPLLDAAATATTRLARSLISHAFAGAVPLPAGRLLLALAGHGDPAAALSATLQVGASSGRALAGGIREGVRAAVAA